MTPAILIDNLTKSYRSKGGALRAIDGLNLEVPTGEVFGFLGANGAGKTTTIRAVVGHTRATSGTIQIFGMPVPQQLPAVIDRIGALVESPLFFPNFSGRKNLELLARSRRFPLERVDESLETVGLQDRANSRFSSYSLGMKQRLGVASVLLKDPDLLILDEPANGLDPPGILEMRNLIRTLSNQGKTVFVSSHILSEIEHTCDRVAIIARGKLVRTGSVQEILNAGTTSRFTVKVPGGAATRENAARSLLNAGWQVFSDERGDMLVDVAAESAHEITSHLAGQGLWVSELSPVARSLEDAFLELTSEATRGES